MVNIIVKSLMYKSYFLDRCKSIEAATKCNQRIYTRMYIHTSLHFYTLHSTFHLFVNIIVNERMIIIQVLQHTYDTRKK